MNPPKCCHGPPNEMQSSIILPMQTFLGLSQPVQQEIRTAIGIDRLEPSTPESWGYEPVELTQAMVRKLTDGLGEKTKTALKVIASSEISQFHMKDVIIAIDGAEDYMDVRAVWAALTRRTRRICGDPEVFLVDWIGDEIHDSDDNYIDHL